LGDGYECGEKLRLGRVDKEFDRARRRRSRRRRERRDGPRSGDSDSGVEIRRLRAIGWTATTKERRSEPRTGIARLLRRISSPKVVLVEKKGKKRRR